ncbi:hypothetical protein, partial [Amycolatopsis alkalitolerans]|uniref:hypothetical protein n=1 Tax=Amycolatopsis alkalitolerans TaxID=2547244 RepID=UPI001F29426E
GALSYMDCFARVVRTQTPIVGEITSVILIFRRETGFYRFPADGKAFVVHVHLQRVRRRARFHRDA